MIVGDHKLPVDKPGPGIPGTLIEKAKKQVEGASHALEKQGVPAQTPAAENIAKLAANPVSGDDLNLTGRELLPIAHGQADDILVTDQLGAALTLRIEDGRSEQIEQALNTDQGHVAHPIRIRVLEKKREVGRANLTLEVEKKFNAATGHFDQVHDCRMRLNDIEVPGHDRKRGIGSLMLERAEDLARGGGAREVYGSLDSERARSFFERHGYQIGKGRYGGQEVHKAL